MTGSGPSKADARAGRLAPVALVGRAELRQRWVVVVAVGLLLGVAGGVGIGCLAGARRTSSIFHRHLVASDGPDLEIDPGSVTPEADRAVRSLPGVIDARYWVVTSVYPLTPKGGLDLRFRDLISLTTDGRYIDRDRVSMASGRRVDPTRPDEVMVNQSFMDVTGLKVGSTIPIATFETDDEGAPAHPDKPLHRVTARIVGVMVLNEEIASEAIDVLPRMLVSPAYVGPEYYGYSWYALRIDPSVSPATVERRWSELAAAHNAHLAKDEEGWLTYVHRTSDLERKASRAVRPLSTTLAAFGFAAFLAAVVLAAQSLSREVRTRREVIGVARVLGLSPVQAFVSSLVVPGLALAVAAVAGVVTTVLVSMAFPIGPFAVLEPNPGVDVDGRVLGPLLALLVVIPLLLVVVAAVRALRVGTLGADEPTRQPSRVAAAAASAGGPPSWVAALRLTFDPGTGRRYVPTRSVLISSILAVAAAAAVLVFGHNLDALAHEPARFGWAADGGMASDGGYSPFDASKLRPFVAAHPEITATQLVATGQIVVGRRKIPGAVFGAGPRHLRPTLLSGRAPADAGELALGAATLRSLHAHVGGHILVGEAPHARRFLVTGVAVFPVLGPVLAARTGLDDGIWVDSHDFRLLDSVQNALSYGLPVNSIYSLVLMDLRPGTSVKRLQDAARRTSGLSFGSSVDVTDVIRPAEVRTAAAAGGRSQGLLAAVLAATAGLSILFALSAVVRRRRTELAVYRVLGFTPGQVRSALLMQGVILLGIAALVGVPLGVVVGRALWRAFAERLGVVPDPLVPVPVLLLLAVVALLVGVVGSLGPAIVAARVRPARAFAAE